VQATTRSGLLASPFFFDLPVGEKVFSGFRPSFNRLFLPLETIVSVRFLPSSLALSFTCFPPPVVVRERRARIPPRMHDIPTLFFFALRAVKGFYPFPVPPSRADLSGALGSLFAGFPAADIDRRFPF